MNIFIFLMSERICNHFWIDWRAQACDGVEANSTRKAIGVAVGTFLNFRTKDIQKKTKTELVADGDVAQNGARLVEPGIKKAQRSLSG